MKHRIYHSTGLRERLPEYAQRLQLSLAETEQAFQWLLDHDGAFERGAGAGSRVWISSVDIESRIEDPNARRLYAELKLAIPAKFLPLMGLNWPTFKDRWLRVWEQIYNIFINKIPVHAIRVGWLRLGGAKIGKGSSVWRNTEVLGVENLIIGADSVVAWHCVLDARAGLRIGDHVAIASYVLFVAGSHDLSAPEFWSVASPIVVEDYVWIATRALVGPGSHLEHGCVISAQALVSKRVPAYKIFTGSDTGPMRERAHDLTYKVGGRGLFTFLH